MQCSQHGMEFAWHEAGVSKTGKSYPGFWACPGKNQDGSFCKMKPTETPPQPVPKAAPQVISQNVWEAKDRLSAAQTALNCVANVYQGQGGSVTSEQIQTRFNFFYNLLRNAKNGSVPDIAPKNIPLEAKIANNPKFTPPEPEVPTIALEDIPF